MLKKYIIIISAIILSACSVNQNEQEQAQCSTEPDRSKMLAHDIRLWQGTVACELSKAVQAQDSSEIIRLVTEENVPVDFLEPKFGRTLLMWAVERGLYYSVHALLIAGADPNLSDNSDGKNAVIIASDYGPNYDNNTDILKLILDYGGDPNSIEKGDRREGNNTRNTPLIVSCACCYEKTKLLIEAGANINFKNEFGQSALKSTTFGFKDCEKILRYLLIEKSADISLYESIDIDGQKHSLSESLRDWLFPLDSDQYKIKMEIVDYLISQGDNYWETPIPERYYELYDSTYLAKY